MANKLAGQWAEFSRARATFYSTSDEALRQRAARLMAEVVVQAPANGFAEDQVTQGEDVPDAARELAAGMKPAPEVSDDDPDELVRELRTPSIPPSPWSSARAPRPCTPTATGAPRIG